MDKIYKILTDLGMPVHLSGFKYAHDAIEYIISEEEQVVMMRLYETIGEKDNASSIKTERNIRNAITITNRSGNLDKWKNIFGSSELVTNAQFLHTIAFLVENSVDGQKKDPITIICVDGYKAFHGTIKISPSNEKSFEITADWLYRPDTDCWHCNSGHCYDKNICKIILK